MDLLVEKGDSRTYLSSYKVITTSFEESSPSVKRNNTQIQYRNGNVDFGGWHEAKKIDYVGYYRADDIDEEETLREKIYALLSDPDGYYITQLKNDSDNSYERPGENTGDYFEKQVNRPSHKRFYVYASSLESELVGSYGGHVLYKISATFTTMKLPYGESVPRDLDIKPNVPYYGRNLLTGTKDWQGEWGNFASWLVDDEKYEGFTVRKRFAAWYSLGQYYDANPNTTYTFGFYAKASETGNIMETFTLDKEDWSSPVVSPPIFANQAVTTEWQRYSVTFTTKSGGTIFPSVCSSKDNVTIYVAGYKLEQGDTATPWSPAPADPGYNKWYLNTYYNTNNLVIPYAGTVICNQLEQGFTVEFTAKEAGNNFKLNVNGTKLTYNGQLSIGDVLKLSGYEYTKNDISIVKSTNKAYFKLLPGIANKISSSIAGKIRILNFQNLYA